MPYDANKEEEVGAVGEELGESEEQEEGEAQALDAASKQGNSSNNERGGNGGRARRDEFPSLKFQTYKEATDKHYLHLSDNDMVGRSGNQDFKCTLPDSKSFYNQRN